MKKKEKYFLDSFWKRFLAGAMDGAGSIFLRPRQYAPIDIGTIRKILLIRLDHIGDVLMTTPALRALRKAIPGVKIHLLVKDLTAPVVELNPYIDRIIRLNAPWTATGREKASWREVARTARSLRMEKYDCVIGFRPDPREAFLAYATGARIRIGYGVRGGGFCFTHLIDFDPEKHEIRRAIDLLSPLGVVSDSDEMDFIISDRERKRAGDILEEITAGEGGKLVGIHPGAASPFKRWSEPGFARLGDLLIENGYRVLFLGGTTDRELLAGITGRMKKDPAVITGIDLRVLGAVIEKLDLLVCNDSAPSHIAQAVGTPAVVLYGPTHDEVTGPLDRKKHRVMRNPVPCSPCWLPGTRFECEYDLRCWKGLRAEEGLKVVTEITAGSRPDLSGRRNVRR